MIVLGIDIGGTSIKGAVVRDNGEVLDLFSIQMQKLLRPQVTIGKMCDEINKFLMEHSYDEPISGIGLGVPGIMDKKKGIIVSSPNLPKWINFNIKEFVSKRTNLPVKIVNDASAAVLGEARFGAGKDCKNLIMITLGTGVGGGIIINGKLYDGLDGMGAQLGHEVIVVNGRKCTCGRRGCLEAYASATALIKQTEKALKSHPDSLIKKYVDEYGRVSARVPFLAEKDGDEVAHKIVEEYVMYLSEGLLDFCNIFRPELIVLSGGVANEGDYLISRIVKYLEEHNYGYKGSPVIPVRQASLGYNSGRIGAASLFFF